MPIYDYVCGSCGYVGEDAGGDLDRVRCSSCGEPVSERVERPDPAADRPGLKRDGARADPWA